MLIKEMLIKLPEDINDLYFCGDIHGNLDYLKYFINTGVGFPQKISNSCIVLCGDVGLGFSPDLESMKISFLNKLCEKTNNYIIAIRGNHDDPQQFKNLYNKRFKAVEDYSVIQYKDKNILCIRGGTSIDRIYRKIINGDIGKMKRLLSWTILIQFHIVKLLRPIVLLPVHTLME